MKKSNKGFTLIELLVVVLIIGILAAIAVPQYQKAVDKAEFLKYQTMVHSLRNAYEEYVLATGNSTANFNDLSISIPANFTISEGRYSYSFTCVSNEDMHCCITHAKQNSPGSIYCMRKDYLFGYEEDFLTQKDKLPSNQKYCIAKYEEPNFNKTRQAKLCQETTKSAGSFYRTLNTPNKDLYLGQITYIHFDI